MTDRMVAFAQEMLDAHRARRPLCPASAYPGVLVRRDPPGLTAMVGPVSLVEISRSVSASHRAAGAFYVGPVREVPDAVVIVTWFEDRVSRRAYDPATGRIDISPLLDSLPA